MSKQKAHPRQRRDRVVKLMLLAVGVLSPLTYLPGSCTAADYTQRQGPATLRIRAEKIEGGQVEIRLSDALPVTVSVEGTASLEVQPARTLVLSPDWEMGRTSKVEKTTLPDGRMRWQQTFRLKPTKAGELTLPLAPLPYRESTGDNWHDLTWKAIPVRVTTEIANADLSELRDSTGPEEISEAPSWQIPYVWLGLASGLLLLLFVGWQLTRRRRHRQITLSPHAWALKELDRVQTLPLASEKEIEHFHNDLSNVIRRYLEIRLQIPALERTTAEFFASIRASPHLTVEQQSSLRALMESWDLVKFAQVRPSAEECLALALLARGFVEETAANGTAPVDDMSIQV
jgi:hypothetical protein